MAKSGGGVRRNTLTPGIRRVADRYPDVVGRGLMEETEIETTEVRRRTPIDLGPLVGSVHAEGPFRRMRSIYSMIVAGGPAAGYAIIVHEDPVPIHPVGQWKFIESVLMEARAYFAGRVARRIQLNEALASGFASIQRAGGSARGSSSAGGGLL